MVRLIVVWTVHALIVLLFYILISALTSYTDIFFHLFFTFSMEQHLGPKYAHQFAQVLLFLPDKATMFYPNLSRLDVLACKKNESSCHFMGALFTNSINSSRAFFGKKSFIISFWGGTKRFMCIQHQSLSVLRDDEF